MIENRSETVENLLKHIHFYYPIRFGSFEKNYEGEKLYHQILEKKINEIIENKETVWTNLIQSIKQNFNYDVFDLGYTQFPSYTFTLERKKESTSFFNYQRKMIVCVSLLCEYYTIFFEDFYLFNNYTENVLRTPQVKIVFSTLPNFEQQLTDLIADIHIEIRKGFTNYEYVNPEILMRHKIQGGKPYTEIEQNPKITYSIYNFLFDSFYSESNVFMV